MSKKKATKPPSPSPGEGRGGGAAGQATPALRPPFRKPQTFNFAGVGRNDICPCGSGKRFKNCHGS